MVFNEGRASFISFAVGRPKTVITQIPWQLPYNTAWPRCSGSKLGIMDAICSTRRGLTHLYSGRAKAVPVSHAFSLATAPVGRDSQEVVMSVQITRSIPMPAQFALPKSLTPTRATSPAAPPPTLDHFKAGPSASTRMQIASTPPTAQDVAVSLEQKRQDVLAQKAQLDDRIQTILHDLFADRAALGTGTAPAARARLERKICNDEAELKTAAREERSVDSVLAAVEHAELQALGAEVSAAKNRISELLAPLTMLAEKLKLATNPAERAALKSQIVGLEQELGVAERKLDAAYATTLQVEQQQVQRDTAAVQRDVAMTERIADRLSALIAERAACSDPTQIATLDAEIQTTRCEYAAASTELSRTQTRLAHETTRLHAEANEQRAHYGEELQEVQATATKLRARLAAATDSADRAAVQGMLSVAEQTAQALEAKLAQIDRADPSITSDTPPVQDNP
jgi:predicted  nucleic acid-binding Zn-ribbon protein